MKKIRIISKSESSLARQMLNEYLLELAEFDDTITFDEKGTPIYKWFDNYFIDKDRFPFFLIVDGAIAGLCLIRELDLNHYDFAEFYVCKEFRKDDNALWFASQIESLFNGKFTFSTRLNNVRAVKFWTKFSKTFDDRKEFDDEIWKNFVINEKE